MSTTFCADRGLLVSVKGDWKKKNSGMDAHVNLLSGRPKISSVAGVSRYALAMGMLHQGEVSQANPRQRSFAATLLRIALHKAKGPYNSRCQQDRKEHFRFANSGLCVTNLGRPQKWHKR